VTPKAIRVRQDDTHRLVPARHGDASVLARLADPDEPLDDLFDLDAATNERLLGEANLLPGISVHELLFGVTYAHVVNAAFTHASPSGSRFNGADRGAWYAAFDKATARAEVAFHKTQELEEIAWREPETFTLDDYLADFRADFHDIRKDPAFVDCLAPTDYARSQALAATLVAAGSAGLVYPSVRRKGGTCIVCFRPALVTNVRRAGRVTMTVRSSLADR
jgi:RES domain-containing protein